MSFQAVAWAIEVRVGDPILKNLLMAICHHAHRETWDCWPSQELLAFETEVSKRTIQRKMEELEEKGFIRVEKRRKSDGTQDNSKITVTGRQIVTLHPPVDNISLTGGQKPGSPGDNTCPPVSKQEEQVREQEKKDGASAPIVNLFPLPDSPPSEEKSYFDRSKEILGPKGNGLAAKLLKSKGRVIATARAAMEVASMKSDPAAYIGGIIRAVPSEMGAAGQAGYGDDWF